MSAINPTTTLACRLSPLQEGLLFHSLAAPGSGLYLVQMRMRLHRLDRQAFQAAWQAVVDRHEMLRTAFDCTSYVDARQVIAPALTLRWEEQDWRGLDDHPRERCRQDHLQADRARDFDIAAPPLMRLALIAIPDDMHEFVWTFHHALLDGWSVPLLLNEVATQYQALTRGVPTRLSPARPYRDYIAWLAQQDEAGAEAFWRDQLRRVETPSRLGVDGHGAPATSDARGHHTRTIPARRSARWRAFAREHGLTPYTIAHAAWAVLLSRYTGDSHVVFGVTVAGRPSDLPGADSMVGLFINTVPTVIHVEDGARLLDWLARLQRAQHTLRRFELTPLARIQAWRGGRRQAPLFETTFTFENYPLHGVLDRATAAGLIVTELEVHERSTYPIAMTLSPGPEMRMTLEYDRGRFGGDVMQRLLDHYEHLLDGIVSGRAPHVRDLEMLAEDERHRLRGYSRGPGDEYPKESTVHALVEAQVDRTPEALAVIDGSASVTYAELDGRANQLAHVLTRQGVTPGSMVGVCLPHSIDLIIALLATLKAGASYVPIDPTYPAARIAFMLADARAAVLLTHRDGAPDRSMYDGVVMALDAMAPALDREAPSRPRAAIAATALAYVMYTSGSTGTPKGVMVSHRALNNYVSFAARAYDRGRRLSVALHSSVSFDLTVTSIYVPLVAGGTIRVYRRRDDGALPLHEIIRADRTGLLKLTPSHAALIREQWAPNRRIERIIVGGEALPTALAREIQEGLIGHPAIVNEYGPTEATVGCAVHTFAAGVDVQPFVPVGRPVSNAQIYVLDRHLHFSPEGVAGEIYIGGDGVADGYCARPGPTAQRFVPDPFGPRAGARLYRTGDLARWLPGGVLDYIGRRDDQVKYHGYRIELNEIRLAMTRHPHVQDSAVVVRREHEDARMIAYYVADRDLDPIDLRSHLSRHVLRETLPNAYIRIDRVPLTPNGKIDFDALPDARQRIRVEARAFAAPQTTIQRDLCEIWAAVLRRDRVGITDDYFELGGDSIGNVLIASRAQQRGLPVTARDPFDYPTIESLAHAIAARLREAARTGGKNIATGAILNGRLASAEFPLSPLDEHELAALRARIPDLADVYPLSPVQEGMLFHTLRAPGSGVYLPQLSLQLEGLDPDLFQRAWARVIARHAILRTAVVYQGVSTPVQVVRRAIDVAWEREDWRDLDAAAQQERLAAHLRRVCDRGLALDEAPIMTFALMQVGRDEHVFAWSFHHILLDAWSVACVLGEVMACYGAFRRDREPALAPARPYRDYLAWLRQQDRDRARTFWTQELSDVAVPTRLAPGGEDVAAASMGHGGRPRDRYDRQHRTLSAEASAQLRTFAGTHRLTLNTLLLGAWALVMRQYARTDAVLFGTVVSGRPADVPDVESIPGLFINTLPLKIEIPRTQALIPWLQHLQSRQIDARASGYLALSEIQACSAVPRGVALFDTIFTFESHPTLLRQEEAHGLRVSRIDRREHDHYACSVVVTPGEEIGLAIDYDADRFPADAIARLLQQFARAAIGLAADPARLVAEIPVHAADDPGASWLMPADEVAPVPVEYVAPETSTERRIAAVWQEVLHVDRIGRHDNFFALGGDSMLSIKVASRLQAAGIVTTVADLFEYPTVAALARDEGREPTADVPLTPIQRQHFEERRNPHHRNQSVLLEVEGLDLVDVERVVARWLTRHDALRMRYHEGETGWTATVADREAQRVATLVDLSRVSASAWPSTIERVGASLQASLHVTRGPLLRVALIRGGAHGNRLLVTIHHLAIDAVSWRLLLADWSGEDTVPLTPFRTWARRLHAYARTPAIAADAAYWLDLSRRPTPSLPLDDAHGEPVAGRTASRSTVLSATETDILLQEVRGQRVSLHEWLIAAVATAVGAWTGAMDVQIDVEGHGRDELMAPLDVSRTVGWFTTVYPVTLRLPSMPTIDPDPAWPATVASVAAQLRRVPHGGFGYGLLRYLRTGTSVQTALAAAPRPSICFNHLGQMDQGLGSSGFRLGCDPIGPAQDPAAPRAYELEIVSRILDGALTIDWIYSPARLTHDTIQRLATHCGRLLRVASARVQVQRSQCALAALELSEMERVIARYPDLEDVYPLAPVQLGMIFHSRYAPASGLYIVRMHVRVKDLDHDAFQRAWALAIARHAILRTAFVDDDLRSPVQVVCRTAQITWDLADWCDVDEATQRDRMASYFAQVCREGLPLRQAPVMRLALRRMSRSEHCVLWAYHHVLLDGWSSRVLLREIVEDYTACRAGREPHRRPAPQYRDYIAWLLAQDPGDARRFWEEMLDGAPRTVLGRSVAPTTAPAGLHSDREAVTLSAALTRRLRTIARARHLTLNTLLQAAWALVLAHHTGAHEVTFGITVSGRPADLPGVESLIGNLINTVPLRVAVIREMTIEAYLEGIFARNTAIRRHEHTAVQQIRDAASREPLFDSILAFQNFPDAIDTGDLIAFGGREYSHHGRDHYPLSLGIVPGRTNMVAEICYDTGRFTRDGILRLLVLLDAACEALGTTPHGTVGEALRAIAGHEPYRSSPTGTRRQTVSGAARGGKS